MNDSRCSERSTRRWSRLLSLESTARVGFASLEVGPVYFAVEANWTLRNTVTLSSPSPGANPEQSEVMSLQPAQALKSIGHQARTFEQRAEETQKTCGNYLDTYRAMSLRRDGS